MSRWRGSLLRTESIDANATVRSAPSPSGCNAERLVEEGAVEVAWSSHRSPEFEATQCVQRELSLSVCLFLFRSTAIPYSTAERKAKR